MSPNSIELLDSDLWGGLPPYEYQVELANDMHWATALIGEVGPGKTTAGCVKGMLHSLRFSDNLGLFCRWEETDLWGTVWDVWKGLYPLKTWGPDGKGIYSCIGGEEKPAGLRFYNGSLIEFVGVKDEQAFAGKNAGWIFWDQAEQGTWAQMKKLLRRVRRGQVPEDFRQLWMTVNEEANYYWIDQVFNKLKNPDTLKPFPPEAGRDFHVIRNPVQINKPVLGKYYDRLERILDEEESKAILKAQSNGMYGKVFPMAVPSVHGKKAVNFSALRGQGDFWLMYDEGANAPTALIFGHRARGGKVRIGAELYEPGLTVNDEPARAGRPARKGAKTLAKEVAARYGFPLHKTTCMYVADWSIRGDRGGIGKSIADLWGDEWPWTYPGTKDADVGYKGLQELFLAFDEIGDPMIEIDLRCEHLWDELLDLTFNQKKVGQWDFVKRGPTVKNHAIDAVTYGYTKMREPREEKRAKLMTQDQMTSDPMGQSRWASKDRKHRGIVWPDSRGFTNS